jgi:hypothetical protein
MHYNLQNELSDREYNRKTSMNMGFQFGNTGIGNSGNGASINAGNGHNASNMFSSPIMGPSPMLTSLAFNVKKILFKP